MQAAGGGYGYGYEHVHVYVHVHVRDLYFEISDSEARAIWNALRITGKFFINHSY